MNNLPRSPRIWFWGAVCVYLVIYFLDSLWSESVDLAHHYVLVARLAEHWHLPLTNDPSLAEMASYPRYSHILAAIAGVPLASPLIGIQLVTLVSLLALWSAFGFMFLSLPLRVLGVVFPGLAALLVTNRWLIHMELHGHEVVGNFFFAQLVAQAMVVALVALALYWERRRGSRPPCYALLGGATLVIVGTHLLPALELLAVLILLVAVDGWQASRAERPRLLLIGALSAALALGLTLVHPAFKAMRLISNHNGQLDLTYVPNLPALGALGVVVMVLSGFLLFRWLRLTDPEERHNGLVLKYLGLYGLAVAGTCTLQIMAYIAGYGSEYSCRKYAIGLNTVLVLDLALLAGMLVKRQWRAQDAGPASPSAILFGQASLGVFVLVAVLTVVPRHEVLDTSDLVAIERFASQYRATQLTSAPGRFDYAVGLRGLGGAGNYLVSVGVLKAPRSANAYDLLFQKPLSKPNQVGNILTSENAKPWDVPACRRHISPDSLVVVDGACVIARLISPRCQGKIDFSVRGDLYYGATTGFSFPEAHGRWNDGPAASFTCKVPPGQKPKPRKARISTIGFVMKGHTQRMFVSINGTPPREFRYETEGEAKVVELDLPPTISNQLDFRFTFPDAIAPKALGLSTDTRELAVGIREVDFD